MQTAKVSEINKLSTPEKILFLEELWDTIAINNSEIPVPDSHKAEFEKRLKRHLDTLGKLLTLNELQERIESRK